MSGTPAVSGRTVLVAGLGVSGAAAARVLLAAGARVLLTDAARPAVVDELTGAGAGWLGATEVLPDGVDLVVTSPGWRPDAPLLVDAAARGVEVVGEPELAWRLRVPGPDGAAAPWFAVTGTNGKTTTVTMLEAILLAAGRKAVAAGNVGRPLVEVVTAREADGTPSYDALAVELSSFQLHWSSSLAPAAAAVLNVADDHTDWHGSFPAYRDAKARILERAPIAVADAGDPVAAGLVAAHPRPVTVTLGEPAPGQLGVRDGVLVDRAFAADPAGEALLERDRLPVPGPHNVVNALAAAALARSAGVSAEAVARGLAGFAGGAHRNALVATVDGVDWVDDSKATNPHAAGASLASYPRVVWIAGGLLKGADVDPLVAAVAPRLTGVVLLGRDRAVVARSLARHAPSVPVVEVPSGDDGGMDGTGVTAEATITRVVAAAAGLARPGDTVLLAPAAASMDVFRDYAHRGRAFADAVRALGAGR
ncbi:UDP-N-acetylmuramoyl-L-alanine--D-glutamate ligase [Blastococcus sp. MG754426]|uniref:UDP-N-acetylmuramoyl-L-alanine--D-glutamate ligase n=1 Tax=unclassified Blastococcus TaxID=2619396 RepID=UPI001EF0D3A4|nr:MULTISPECIES: UDP-N-acetylmuramoyl-L-alanine--D-glutamate ligase [unclassified Blastococcus]MCF6509498.1 UDP-N-acetylmuramoyl-L-alanine--D-glutamate ligase [Blastococcus sp. MG754426]MCF6514094.1 UDP-N-acetylmuramoyl-L-alanine--D-glutamate ligase [Blastococcus sp. MG754427]MCF6737214.1 UDP-N-acetylmuramoyl-L-alanine--D-glutamate ligase [Blastococcus sp. KM273129]